MNNPELEQQINNNHLLGAIQFQGSIRYFLSPIAYWIMDYKTYDPEYDPKDYPEHVFRNNILQVSSANALEYIDAMHIDEVDKNAILDYNSKHAEYPLRMQFFINFDERKFVSSFFDIDVHEYIPADWQGVLVNEITNDDRIR